MNANETKMRVEIDHRKLARAYVALAYARDVASSYIKQTPAHARLHPILTMLDMTNGLLEEVLEHSMPEEMASTESEACSEFLM